MSQSVTIMGTRDASASKKPKIYYLILEQPLIGSGQMMGPGQGAQSRVEMEMSEWAS